MITTPQFAEPAVWSIVPAAGTGSRMRSEVPKQYLRLLGRTLIEHTLGRLLSHPRIGHIHLVLDEQDERWAQLPLAHDERVIRVAGGRERCFSVRNALQQIAAEAKPYDWVLVHDVARPCLRLEDLDRLLQDLWQDPVGGLLGVPVSDTLKRTDKDGKVVATIDRQQAWRAYTPQMFRFQVLADALARALDEGVLVTDEASAVEYVGLQPRMVEGHGDNIKITVPGDLALAEMYLLPSPIWGEGLGERAAGDREPTVPPPHPSPLPPGERE